MLSSQTFSSIVNTDIPDDGTTLELPLLVSGLPSVIDTTFGLESVCINLDHTWDSDLLIKLYAPDGTAITLISGVGGDGDNFTNTCITENSDTPFSSGIAPYTGEFKPTGDMGAVNNGQDPNGTWTLYIYDTYPFADEGYFYDFSISFGDEPAIPFYFLESNIPIFIINTDGETIYDEPKTEAHFSIIYHGDGMMNHPDDTDFYYQGKILVELQGYTGPYYPKVNYDFDFVNNELIEIDTSIFGMPSENDFILKAEYLDYSLLKNSLTYEMSRRMGRYAPRTQFGELVLNGEYMGVYTLTEKIKRDENRVDIAKLDADDLAGDSLTGGYIFEMNINGQPGDWYSDFAPVDGPLEVEFKMVYPRSEEIAEEQLNYIHAYTDSFEYALHGSDFLDSINGYRNLISVKSFIDFMLVNEFSANYDSYGRSTFLFKDKNKELNIGPPWDYDRAYAPWTVEGWVWEITHGYWPFPFWWSKFREDPEWRDEVYCRWTDLRQSVFSTDSFLTFIDSNAEYLHDAALRNFERWGELAVSDYDYEIDVLKQFVQDRLIWIDEALEADAVSAPEISFSSATIAEFEFTFSPSIDSADSYAWDFGDGNFSEEKYPTHLYADAGLYTVSLSTQFYYGCISTFSSTIDVIDHIEEQTADAIQVYPNPFKQQFFINNSLDASATIEIFNHAGQLIMKQKMQGNSEIAIVGNLFPAGIYTLKVQTENQVFYRKMMKQ